ncbi:MAG: hypothetical protein MJE77_04275 [Proteobacteria bacterium]|nr:hypothetical protein [Pseudomonadota bacterium]
MAKSIQLGDSLRDDTCSTVRTGMVSIGSVRHAVVSSDQWRIRNTTAQLNSGDWQFREVAHDPPPHTRTPQT